MKNSSISSSGGVDSSFLVFQEPTQLLKFVTLPSSANGSSWGATKNFTTWANPQSGSNTAAALFQRGGPDNGELNVFYQTNGSDIIQDADAAGTFENSTLPVT